MAEQELLLLQLLKIPVVVIKYLARILSIATYLPNYLILSFVDHFLFADTYSATLLVYSLMWLPKLALLFFSLALFSLEFYSIYYFLQLETHGIVIQVAGVVLTLAGLLILMRKGYLSLIEKHNLSKLKSVKQHLELGFWFAIDLLGVLLAVVNVAMVVSIKKTLAYDYHPSGSYRYLRHISRTVRESFIIYLQFFYIKIVFRVFPWRFNNAKETYLKEKGQNNVLNCLVLLTLVYFSTCLDLFFFGVMGLPNVVHFKRRIYYQRLGETHRKWRVTLDHFLFVVAHSVQLVVEALVFPVCWKESRACLKLLLTYEKREQLFGKQFQSLLLKSLIRIPYFICSGCLYLLVYKKNRRDLLVCHFMDMKKKMLQEQFQAKRQLIVEEMTFKCFGEQFLDMFFFPLVGLATLLMPWKAGWARHVMRQYVLDREYIASYFGRCLKEYAVFPFAILSNLPFLLYHPRQVRSNYLTSKDNIEKEYLKVIATAKNNGDFVRPSWEYTKKESHLCQFTLCSIKSIKADLPHLPAFFITKATLFSIYDKGLEPTTVPSLLFKSYRQFYRLNVMSSAQSQFYLNMFNRMCASGNLHGEGQKAQFWRLAYKSEKFRSFQFILKLVLKNHWIKRIEENVRLGGTLTEISNHYWHQYQLFKAFLLKLVAVIIEIIVSIIGFVFMLPLTLWRLPTFLKLFLFHKKKSLFFKILFEVYHQMARDVVMLPVHLFCLVAAPKMFVSFLRRTAFQYGPEGIDNFERRQLRKRQYELEVICVWTLITLVMHCQVVFVYATWIRIKYLRNYLRQKHLTTYSLYKQYIFNSPKVPDMEGIMQVLVDVQFREEVEQHLQQITFVFLESLRDLPYLILIAFLLVAMPWRINHILKAIRDTREDKDQRKSFIVLLKNIFKDYACIFMNILLLLSGFKSRKALLLIRRNYRLNFFIGFLEYGYFNELVKELWSLAFIYLDIVYFAVACIFGWPRASVLVRELVGHRRKLREEEESAALNRKIYENTVKSGKELKLLNKMGFYNYVNVCSYLTLPDIIALRQVDKLNYQISKREEIWFTKWETIFSKKYNFVDEEFQARCKKAYELEKASVVEIQSYHTIIMRHYHRNVHEEGVDLAVVARDVLLLRYYDLVFKDYNYFIHEGYGPENQLPQEENEDEEFLRLTNQVRRPKVYQSENNAFANWLVFKPVQKFVQTMHRLFRVDSSRRKKQLIFIGILLSLAITVIFICWKLVLSVLWLEDSLIGIRVLLLVQIVALTFVFLGRMERLYPSWVSLTPFDLYWDVVKGLLYLRDQIWKKKVVSPVSNFIKKLLDLIHRIYLKVVAMMKWVWGKIKAAGQKTADITTKYSKIVYQRVLLPIYIRVADFLRKSRDVLVVCFKKIFAALKMIVNGVIAFFAVIFKSIYNGIYAIFSNANKLYYFILKSTMNFLLKFGLLGNLLFTVIGLLIMTLPTLIWWFVYSERWYLVVSSIHTMVLIVVGYKHLNDIRKGK